MQNKAVRLITNSDLKTNRKVLFKKIGWKLVFIILPFVPSEFE